MSNCVGKVLMTILCHIARVAIGDALDNRQHGLLAGRNITEALINIETAALMLGASSTHVDSALVFLDLAQAFCDVRHDYVWCVLSQSEAHLGFCKRSRVRSPSMLECLSTLEHAQQHSNFVKGFVKDALLQE